MTERIRDVGSVEEVKDHSRRYDDECAEHAKRVIRKLMAEQTQVEFAEAIGYSQSAISRALAPESQPSLRLLIAIARVKNLSLDYLLGLTERAPMDEEAFLEKVALHVEKRLRETPSRPPPASAKLPSSRPKK
jgi:transcriptional regulator with XRE-family HTH domain